VNPRYIRNFSIVGLEQTELVASRRIPVIPFPARAMQLVLLVNSSGRGEQVGGIVEPALLHGRMGSTDQVVAMAGGMPAHEREVGRGIRGELAHSAAEVRAVHQRKQL